MDDPTASQRVCVEYVWVGAGSGLCSKTKVLDAKPSRIEEVPVISVEAEGSFSGFGVQEVYLKPRKLFRDPFRGGDHLLVLCDAFQAPQVSWTEGLTQPVNQPLQPASFNLRCPAENVLRLAEPSSTPLFSAEQEYTVEEEAMSSLPSSMESDGGASGSWPHKHLPDPSQPFYYGSNGTAAKTLPCVGGVRASKARQVQEQHLTACLAAGVKISGTGKCTVPGGLSYKLAPTSGVDMGDHLWVSRHILQRVGENMGMRVLFASECSDGGGGGGPSLRIRFSTSATRSPDTGMSEIERQILQLQAAHSQHALIYGKPSERSAPFTFGLGARPSSVSIPSSTLLRRAGYYIDQRPTGNADPYLVAMLLISSALQVPLPCSLAVALPAEVQAGKGYQGGYSHMHSIAHHQKHHHPAAHHSASHAARSTHSGVGWGCGGSVCSGSASMNTEDVLLDELDRIDGYSPPTSSDFSVPALESSAESRDHPILHAPGACIVAGSPPSACC